MTIDDREFDSRLRAAMMSDEPDASELMARVRQEMQPRRSYRPFAFSAIAATMLIAILSGALMMRTRGSAAVAADAACDHYDEVVRPNDKKWATSQNEVAAYVREHLAGGDDLVRALAPPGASFEKVGTCRLLRGRFAHFVYRSGSGEVSVFVRLESHEQSLRPVDYHDDQLGLQVAAFSTRRYEGLVVTSIAPAATRRIADELAARLTST